MLPITNVDKLPTPEGCICLSNYANTKIDVNLMHGNFIADFRNHNLKSILVDLTDIWHFLTNKTTFYSSFVVY